MDVRPFGGSPLADICAADGSNVPRIVTVCIQGIERMGLDEEGLYRVPGQTALITKLKEKLNTKQSWAGIERCNFVHTLCGLLKCFFRELPEPVFPFNAYEGLMNALGIAGEEEKITMLATIIRNIPTVNYETLKTLLIHLKHVIAYQDKNRM
eukprot:Colp12_sorted_trinity150504_noHs@29992